MGSTAFLRRIVGLLGALVTMVVLVHGAAAQPAGEVVVAFHVTIAPSWFDPSTAPPQITPFGVLHALHDGLVKPLPGQKMGNSLAESWTESPDGLTYEFKMRRVEVPQRRSRHHRGREVQLRAIQGCGGHGAARTRPADRDRRSAHDPVPAQGAVAGFHDVLRDDGHRGGTGRAEEVPDPGRRRRISQAPDRCRPLQVREPHARHRGRAPGTGARCRRSSVSCSKAFPTARRAWRC